MRWCGNAGLIPRSRRSPGEENGNPLQYFCLENSMGRGVWWAIVSGVTESWTRLYAHTVARDSDKSCDTLIRKMHVYAPIQLTWLIGPPVFKHFKDPPDACVCST